MVNWNDWGMSSLTLLAVHSGMDIEEPSVPQDPEDFQRCIHLFECMWMDHDERESLLSVTADKYPIWKPFLDNWDYLNSLYEEEKNNGSAPKLYKAIRELLK